MAENNVTSILDTIVSRLESIAKCETVIGAPVKVGDSIIVPVTKLSIGFGAGGGEGSMGGDKSSSGFGGGGGGGAHVEVTAFIVVSEGKVTVLSTKGDKIVSVLEAIPNIVEKVANLGLKLKGNGEKKEEATEE